MVANCDRWFKRKWELTNHVRTHDDDVLKCDSCNFMTKLKKQLKEHIKTKHDEDLPYECKLCHKKFQYRSGRKTTHGLGSQVKEYEYCNNLNCLFTCISNTK